MCPQIVIYDEKYVDDVRGEVTSKKITNFETEFHTKSLTIQEFAQKFDIIKVKEKFLDFYAYGDETTDKRGKRKPAKWEKYWNTDFMTRFKVKVGDQAPMDGTDFLNYVSQVQYNSGISKTKSVLLSDKTHKVQGQNVKVWYSSTRGVHARGNDGRFAKLPSKYQSRKTNGKSKK